jgi:hypothetical protein
LLEILPTIKQKEIIDFYEDYFINHPKMLVIHAIAEAVHKVENENLKKKVDIPTEYSSSIQFIKRRIPLYPDAFS